MQSDEQQAAERDKKIAEYIGIPIPACFMPQSYASVFQEPGAIVIIIGFQDDNFVRLQLEVPDRGRRIYGYSRRTIRSMLAKVEEAAHRSTYER